MKNRNNSKTGENHNIRLIFPCFLFLVLFSLMLYRLFEIQIVNGTAYETDFELKIKKERTIKNVRGNIYDRDGALLAGNKLVYNITMEDNGDYSSIREKQLSLNSIIYQIVKTAEQNKEELINGLPVTIDENGDYVFDVKGKQLDRFRADVYGFAKIEQMSKEQAKSSAEELMEYLCSQKKFALYQEDDKEYSDQELRDYKLERNYSKETILNIIGIRYMLSLNTYQRYLPVTVATDVSDKTVAVILENSKKLCGVNIAKDYVRFYEGGEAFAHIIGYTGQISSEELNNLKKQGDKYSESSVIGKAGIEQYMDSTLQGTDGTEVLYVNNLGKVLAKKRDRIEPKAGENVYLTIDKDLQNAAYQVLEQHIAGILTANIRNIKEFDTSTIKDASEIVIPIDDIYYALIKNNIIDINHFSKADARKTEQEVYDKIRKKQKEVWTRISDELMKTTNVYNGLDEEMQEYQDYIVNNLMKDKLGILSVNTADKTVKTYLAWTEGSISLKELISYAIKKKWIDLTKIPSDIQYLDSEQAYQLVADEIITQLKLDTDFNRKMYRYMLRDNELTGNEICRILCEQGMIPESDSDYSDLLQGKINSYQFMKEKIRKLQITPAQLALDPCSGSVVIVKPDTGEVLACVTYPGYDNNRLANKPDNKYYSQLLCDLSLPLYNRATQQKTAPGSTFKPVTAIAGLQEQVITSDTNVYCDGVFDKLEPALHCWKRSGHGEVDSVSSALKNSCNDYICEIAYQLGMYGNSIYSEKQSLEKLQKYAGLFDLDKKSGIEISESAPHVTNQYAIPSSIGQGTHNYTTTQLARYVTTLANEGTSYQLSILDKVTQQDGTLVKDYKPEIQSKITLPSEVWYDIRSGMQQVVQNNKAFEDLNLSAAGKTGTAEEVKNRPNHGLFVGYAPVNNPEIAVAVRIANGYSSGNAAGVAKDVFDYYFNLKDKSLIITGTASQASSNAHID